jgi:hypothetical protein
MTNSVRAAHILPQVEQASLSGRIDPNVPSEEVE